MLFACVISLVFLLVLCSGASKVSEVKEDESYNEALFEAAKVGDAEGVRSLIKAGHAFSDEAKNKTLKFASFKGFTEVLRVLEASIDFLKFDEKALNEALFTAFRSQKVDVFEFLVSSNFKFSKDTNNKAFIWAAGLGLKRVLELLAASKEWELVEGVMNEAAICASKKNHSKVLAFLAEKGATTTPAPTKEAVLQACELGNDATVEYFVSRGPEFDLGFKIHAFFQAAIFGRAEILKIFRKAGWEFAQMVQEKAFVIACTNGHVEVAKVLLSNNNIEIRSCAIGEGLVCAASHNEIAMLEYLTSRNSSFSATEKKFALCYAALNNHCATVTWLLRKSRLDFTLDEKNEALIYADIEAHVEVIELLLQSGATFDCSAVDRVLFNVVKIRETVVFGSIIKNNLEFSVPAKYEALVAALQEIFSEFVETMCSKMHFEESIKSQLLLDLTMARNGSVLQLILNKKITFFSQENMDKALCYTIYFKNMDALQSLLNSHWQFSPGAMKEALFLAKKASMDAAIEHLERSGATFTLTPTNEALLEAAENGYFETVTRLILTKFEFSSEAKDETLVKSAASRSLGTIHYLINSGWIFRSDAKNRALVAAAATGTDSVVKCLLSTNWKFNDGEQKEALFQAAKAGNPQVAETLMKKFEYDQETKEETFVIVCSGRYHSIMHYMIVVHGFKPSESTQNRAFIEATKHKNLEAIKFIISQDFKFSAKALRKALVEAAMLDNPTTLRCLLGSRVEFNNAAREAAFVASCTCGRTANVEYMLRRWSPSSPEVIDKALVQTAKLGKVETFLYLLSSSSKISSSDKAKNKSFTEASFEGHADILNCIVNAAEFRPSAETLKESLEHAAERGHTNVVEYLLSQKDFSFTAESQNSALLHSAKNGHAPVFALLIGTNWEFDQEAKDKALVSASTNGHAKVVECLVEQNGFGCSAASQNEALLQSSKNGDAAVFTLLIGTNWEFDQQARDEVLVSASENGRTEILSSIANPDASFGEYSKYQALTLAAKNRHIGALQCLVRGGMGLDERAKAEALIHASSQGHVDVVSFLLEAGLVFSNHAADESLYHAVKQDHGEVSVLLICSKLTFSAHATDLALVHASKKGNVAIVKSLLSRKDEFLFGDYARGEALRQANHGKSDITAHLLQEAGFEGNVDSRASEAYDALIDAASKGHHKMVLYITSDSNMRLGDISEAIDAARAGGHSRTAGYLEKVFNSFKNRREKSSSR